MKSRLHIVCRHDNMGIVEHESRTGADETLEGMPGSSSGKPCTPEPG